MLLLNTETFRLHNFEGREIPSYAILSHTWGDDEILFQDLSNPESSPFSQRWRQKAAYPKLQGCCRKAIEDGYHYVWIDTCCIDKRSSAELSEAINSMFRYYEQSAVCYVFLADIDPASHLDVGSPCRWFKRGWTLQELIAPLHVRFFDSSWEYIGDKFILSPLIQEITGIDAHVLRHGHHSDSRSYEDHKMDGWACSCGHNPVSIQEILATSGTAKILSWASGRETKRVEDTAYCLMGLFSVNMPLLYGEGSKAFIRLQQEIIVKKKDQSILAWSQRFPAYKELSAETVFSPLARSPNMFQRGDEIGPNLNIPLDSSDRTESYMRLVDGRLSVDILLCPVEQKRWTAITGTEAFAAILDCTMGSDLLRRPVIILCKEVTSSGATNTFRRFSRALYFISPDEPTFAYKVGAGDLDLPKKFAIKIEDAKTERVVFSSPEERQNLTFERLMSPLQITSGLRSRNSYSTMFVVNQQYTKDIYDPWGEINGMTRRGVVCYVTLNPWCPRFMVAWGFRPSTTEKPTLEGEFWCKIWSLDESHPPWLRASNVRAWVLEKNVLDRAISTNEIYALRPDQWQATHTIRLGTSNNEFVTAHIRLKSFLGRTAIELEVRALNPENAAERLEKERRRYLP